MFQVIELLFEAPLPIPTQQNSTPAPVVHAPPIFILFLSVAEQTVHSMPLAGEARAFLPPERPPIPLGRLWMERTLLRAAPEARSSPQGPCPCYPAAPYISEVLPSS